MASLLALGLALSPSTELRLGGVPIGPGELCLLAWGGLAWGGVLLGRPVAGNRALRRLGVFWVVTALALCVGTVAGLLAEPYQYIGGMVHDTAAYALMVALGLAMAIEMGEPARRAATVRRLAVTGATACLLQLASGRGLFVVPGTDPWYGDRLRGWSLDPNQLGLLGAVIVLVALHWLETAKTGRGALLAASCTVPPLVAGLLSQSDTFRLVLLLAAAAYVTVKCVRWVTDAELAPTLRGGAVVLAGLAAPAALGAAVPVLAASTRQIEAGLQDIYDAGHQGETRLSLWREALAVGLRSRLLGYGPGPHLTSKSYKRPPPAKFESHNTPLELFTQAGLAGTAAFLWLCVGAAWRTMRLRLPALAGLMVAALLFSLFHYVLRHPLFWFALVLALLEVAPARPAAARARPPRTPLRPTVARGAAR